MNAFKKIWLLAPVAILGAACGKNTPGDAALKNDLALASQAQMAPQIMSPTEQGLAANPYTTPVRAATRSAPVRTTPVRRTTSSRSSAVYSEPAPQQTRVVKNTKR